MLKKRWISKLGVILSLSCVASAMSPCSAPTAMSEHPTLFFKISDVPDLHAKQSQGLGTEVRDLLLRTADWALRMEIPKEPEILGPKIDLEGTYNVKGVVTAKDFFSAGHALQAVMPVLGVSYYLTGDRRYSRRAIEWLTQYSQWKKFDAGKPDIQGAASLTGLVIGYDMFYPELSTAKRTKLLRTIQGLTNRYVQKAASLSRLPLKGNRARIGNNHNVVPVCGAGLGALLLKLEGVDDGRMLKTVIGCFRNTILPSAFSPQGEYVDGTGTWLVFITDEMAIFFEALRRNGGPTLWEEGNVHKIPEFLIQADSLCAEDAPFNYRWRYALLAMAAVYHDSEIQGLALKEGFRIGPHAEETFFLQHDAPEDGEVIKRWFSSAWEYLFYDSTLQPTPLKPRPLSVLFPNLGRAIIRSSWRKDASVLHFRAGPMVGKENGDNNAFQLTALGEELLPEIKAPFWPISKRGREWGTERDWIFGSRGNNTIIVDGMRQFSILDPKYKGVTGLRRPSSDWLADPGEGVVPRAKIVSFLTSPLTDYVWGEAANAYQDNNGSPLLDCFSRHLLFVKDEYLVLLDEIKGSGGIARDIEWIFHAGRENELSLSDKHFIISPRQETQQVRLDATILAPDVTMRIERVPTRDESYRSPYASIHQVTKQVQVMAIFVMDINRGTDKGREVTLIRNDESATVLRVGTDLVALNKTNGSLAHESLRLSGKLAWIRPGLSAILVEGTNLKWEGKSLIENKSATSTAWVANSSR